jgi:hypothetical protein
MSSNRTSSATSTATDASWTVAAQPDAVVSSLGEQAVAANVTNPATATMFEREKRDRLGTRSPSWRTVVLRCEHLPSIG